MFSRAEKGIYRIFQFEYVTKIKKRDEKKFLESFVSYRLLWADDKLKTLIQKLISHGKEIQNIEN